MLTLISSAGRNTHPPTGPRRGGRWGREI